MIGSIRHTFEKARICSPRRLVIFVGLLTCFTLLLAYTVAKSRSPNAFRPLGLRGEWICAPGGESYAGYFRKTIHLEGTVQNAWMVVAAKDGFEVSVNRNPEGRQYLWRPTRPFQNGGSEKGQQLSHQKPALAMNFPREYQWNGHDNWLLPTYLEFTNSLRSGNNVICVEVESRSCPASVNFYGEILLTSGKRIEIHSDTSWKSEPVPLGPQFFDWTESNYRDWKWRLAERAPTTNQTAWRHQPEEIYSLPFNGAWMRTAPECDVNHATFKTDWMIDGDVDEAWLRIASNRKYELFINDNRVEVQHKRPPDIDNGDWIIGRDSALDPVTFPELLDPDEVDQFFVGKAYQNPREAQANLEEFRNLKPKTHLPFRNYKTTNRAEEGGEFDPTRTLSESRRTPAKPDLPAERPINNSLKRDRAMGGYVAYSIQGRLREGKNRIEIRPLTATKLNWSPTIAVDGQAILSNGRRVSIPSAGDWTCPDKLGNEQSVDVLGTVNVRQTRLPKLTYRGTAQPITSMWQIFAGEVQHFLPYLLCFLLFFAVLTAGELKARLSRRPSSLQPFISQFAVHIRSRTRFLSSILIAGTIALLCGILIEVSFQERHELLWFQTGSAWRWIYLVAASFALFVASIDVVVRTKVASFRIGLRKAMQAISQLPETRIWGYLIVWGLLLCALLRAYKLDFQPLDDDEYASTQAILAILETGVPAFAPDGIYYTRSPLFHYLTAFIAYPFGGTLWSLRLQSVGWSVATVFLSYLFGARLLKSKWVGLGALLLLTIHPFEVFTGHVIRFYQMQQFFALLTIYYFCQGFVENQKQSFRIATLVAFLCAILSQEISVVMAASLVVGYLFFAKDLGWKNNFQLIGISLAVSMVVALDFLVFKTLCLTRTEGVSPVAEAAIQPHFWYPQNFFAVFLGYSRLHIVSSFFLLLGLPLVWKERNRNALVLVLFLIVGSVLTNLLVSHVSLRYQYWLFPIWILASLNSVRLLINWLVTSACGVRTRSSRFRSVSFTLATILMITMVVSWSPWRIAQSYNLKLLGDSTGCVRWVRSQMREGDKLAITEPHTHAAFLETGSVDYDVAVPVLYEFAVQKEGRLVDRNGGGELVGNVDKMMSIFEKHDRVWILLNREKFRTRGKNMRWEYPGARFEVFLRQNCELKHRTYLWNAYLWDASRGHYANFRKQQ